MLLLWVAVADDAQLTVGVAVAVAFFCFVAVVCLLGHARHAS